jgi:hypothetical protein
MSPLIQIPSPGLPLCLLCQRLWARPSGGLACAAFPESIPAPLLDGQADHRKPYPGDQGIRFEPDWALLHEGFRRLLNFGILE